MLLFDDSTIWISVGLATGAAALALFAVAAAVLLARGRRRAIVEQEQELSATSARFETLLADLASALDTAQDDRRRSRRFGGIRETIDLDAVVARALEAATDIPGISAAMIALAPLEGNGGAEPLIATIGMSRDEALRQPVWQSPGSPVTHTVELSYRYGGETSEDSVIRGGLAVPLVSETGDPIGTLAVFWHNVQSTSARQLELVEELARGTGPAIANARRFKEARQLADLDSLTGLHNRRYFHETLARECARAHRYNRRLALVVLDIDDFKAINDRVGHLAGDTLLADVGERVQSVVRSADVACRVGGDEFAVILPESTLDDAEQLYLRLQAAVASRPAGSADRLHLSAGIAELQPDDDSVSLFERADEALYGAKEAGKGRAIASESPA